MKKILLVILLLMIGVSSYAEDSRGRLANIWSSWASVSNSVTTTWTFPYASRDVYVMNSSAVPICVNFKGDSLTDIAGSCSTNNNNSVFLDGGDSIQLFDYVTSSIKVTGMGGVASPVSVVVTY